MVNLKKFLISVTSAILNWKPDYRAQLWKATIEDKYDLKFHSAFQGEDLNKYTI
jgi:hypothetical protein